MAAGGALRLLCIGDMHLGRRPSRLPEDAAEAGIDPSALTPTAAWWRCVEEASRLAREPDGLAAVLLAGDVVESLEDRFEALGPLCEGVEALGRAGLPVLGVAGNHDVVALPRLASRLPGFELLGGEGRWQLRRLEARGRAVEILGWSFPSARVWSSPLEGPLPPRDPGVARVGLLHCDLDAGRSPYAPVSRAALEGGDVDAWLLGHVHTPGALTGRRPLGYLGSLCGLDPGEPGPRGPWLVEVEGPGVVRARHLPLAPLRYERLEIELDDAWLDAEDDPGLALAHRVQRAFAELSRRPDLEAARAVACRVHLGGRSRLRPALRPLLDDPRAWPRLPLSGIAFFVERFVDGSRPALDLEALARGTDPPALVARHLLALESGGRDGEEALAGLARRLDRLSRDGRFALLDAGEEPVPADPARHRDRLWRAGVDTLEALLAQVPEEAR